jgi:exopolyphosphatase / guanosine-5'-triphosphate,3'-diphosphate pyrophosphatase
MTLTFPARLAAIDIGSNAIRMLAAEFSDATTYRALKVGRLPVRLGHEVFDSGELTSATMQSAVKGLRTFKEAIAALSVAQHRAVATSAVRDSRNGAELLERARTDAGIIIEVISGAEEARLVHLAVRNRVPLGRDDWVLADLGGGSLEVSRIDHDRVLATETYPVGSVRLLEHLGQDFDAEDVRRVIEERLSTMREDMLVAATNRFIATGGNIEAVARLAGARYDDRRVFVLEVDRLREITQQLAGLSYEQRIAQLGLREDRADVILPAAIVYEWLAVKVGAHSILVPAVGVKEGVLWDTITKDDQQSSVLHPGG